MCIANLRNKRASRSQPTVELTARSQKVPSTNYGRIEVYHLAAEVTTSSPRNGTEADGSTCTRLMRQIIARGTIVVPSINLKGAKALPDRQRSRHL